MRFDIGYEKEYRAGNDKCPYCGSDRFGHFARCTCFSKDTPPIKQAELNNKGVCIKCGTHYLYHPELCVDEKQMDDAKEMLREMSLSKGEEE